MMCQEYFYSQTDAQFFVDSLNYSGANVEIVQAIDADTGEYIFIVNYYPPKM